MRGLQGKRAIVTGGAQGIGQACVAALISYDCSVVFCDLDEDTGSVTEDELREQGANDYFIQGDMSSETFCGEMVEFSLEKMGVDFLVNNAFSFIAAGLDATCEQWLRSLTVGPMAFATMTPNWSPNQ